MPGNYPARSGDGPRLPVYNRRLSAIETSTYVVCVDTIDIVQHPTYGAVGYVRLYERPLADYGGTGIIVRDANTNAQFSAAITYPPSVGKFYLNPYQGRVFFNKLDVGRKVRVSYSGVGSIIDAEDMNWVYEQSKQAAKPFEPEISVAGSSGFTVQQKYVVALYEKLASGDLLLNPPDVEVKIVNAEDTALYNTVIKNLSTSPRTFLFKALKVVRPEN